jgi:hypothetical protein
VSARCIVCGEPADDPEKRVTISAFPAPVQVTATGIGGRVDLTCTQHDWWERDDVAGTAAEISRYALVHLATEHGILSAAAHHTNGGGWQIGMLAAAHPGCQALGIIGHDLEVCHCTGWDTSSRAAGDELMRRLARTRAGLPPVQREDRAEGPTPG